jgi:hypothetical protein
MREIAEDNSIGPAEALRRHARNDRRRQARGSSLLGRILLSSATERAGKSESARCDAQSIWDRGVLKKVRTAVQQAIQVGCRGGGAGRGDDCTLAIGEDRGAPVVGSAPGRDQSGSARFVPTTPA